jgi:hypothetical protein
MLLYSFSRNKTVKNLRKTIEKQHESEFNKYVM